MLDRLQFLCIAIILIVAPTARAAECASAQPIKLGEKTELNARHGQKLVLSDVSAPLELKDSSDDCERSSAVDVPKKLTPQDGKAELKLPPKDLTCLRYSGGGKQLTLRFEEGKCAEPAGGKPGDGAPAPAKDAEKRLEITLKGGVATPAAVEVSTQPVFVKNDGKAPVTVVCAQGSDQVSSQLVGPGLSAPINLSGVARSQATEVSCSPGGIKLALASIQGAAVAGAPAADAGAKTDEGEAEEDEAEPACDAAYMNPTGRVLTKLVETHGCGSVQNDQVTLCFGPQGEFIGARPPLREGMTVTVLVFARQSANGTFSAEVAFERTLVAHLIDLKGLEMDSDPFVLRAKSSGTLSGLGKLRVTITRSSGNFTMISADSSKSRKEPCPYAELTKRHVLDVAGHYHFSAGVMVTYTHLRDRSFSRQTGDDGVMRIGEQSSPGVDYVLNVTAYPFGVDEEHTPVAAGFLLGTSLASLGKRWYGGVELSSPIGFGLSGGVAVVIVPRLDEPLVAGQPFAGDEFPTHDVAEPTWYLGVNLQAELFKKVFGALFSSDESEGAK